MSMTRDQINDAVDDVEWQRFRISLKGMSTEEKLQRLHIYRPIYVESQEDIKKLVRVANYINALKRGGQLNSNLEIVK